MKKLIFLSIPFIVLFAFAGPRDPKPETPDSIYQNDINLHDEINSRVSKSTTGFCISYPTLCVDRIGSAVWISCPTVNLKYDTVNSRLNISASSNIEGILTASSATISNDLNVNDNVYISGDVAIGTTSSNVGGFGSDYRNIEIRGQAIDTGGTIQLVAPDLSGSGSTGAIAFYNLDGGASVVSRAFFYSYRDGADDALGLIIQTEATGGAAATAFQIDSNGIITRPKQSSFLATAPTNTDNVTGDATAHTIEYDTEIYDLNGDFNTGTYTFTAPVTGKYLLTAHTTLGAITEASFSSYLMKIVTSNRNYQKYTAEGLNYQSESISCVADMDANDTAYVQVILSGGSKSAEMVDDAGNNQMSFSGSLIN